MRRVPRELSAPDIRSRRGADPRGAAASTAGERRSCCQVLAKRHPRVGWPALSTVNEILGRHDLLRRRRGRRRWEHPGRGSLATERANQVWPADFKGQFKTRDGRYCYPLTVTDHFSRSLLLCEGLRSMKTEDAKPAFQRLFREVGTSRGDSHRQRCSVRLARYPGLEPAQRVVDEARDRPSADPSVEPAGKWDPRADASRAQARNGLPPAANLRAAAGPLRSLPRPLQRAASARRDRQRGARIALDPLAATLPRTSGGA